MSDTRIYDFLYAWAVKVLNTDRPLEAATTIIAAHEDAPLPSGTFITINTDPSRNKIGSFSSVNDLVTGSPDYKRTLVNDYELTVELRQVGGGNGLLRILVDSIERQEIKDLFAANNVAYLGEGQITYLPVLQGEKWRQESLVELRLGTAEGTTEQPSYIGDMEYSGAVPAQGRSGNHTITNT